MLWKLLREYRGLVYRHPVFILRSLQVPQMQDRPFTQSSGRKATNVTTLSVHRGEASCVLTAVVTQGQTCSVSVSVSFKELVLSREIRPFSQRTHLNYMITLPLNVLSSSHIVVLITEISLHVLPFPKLPLQRSLLNITDSLYSVTRSDLNLENTIFPSACTVLT